jgi:hypothetical protein
MILRGEPPKCTNAGRIIRKKMTGVLQLALFQQKNSPYEDVNESQ